MDHRSDPALADIASAFSRGTYRALADYRCRSNRGLQTLANLAPGGTTLASAFDQAMAVIRKHYRTEYVYKNAIVSRLIFGRHSPRTASALLEVRAGGSIADVVVFNGTSTAYEIKSDLDNISRLPSQLDSYSKCFEHVIVVTSRQATRRVAALVPEHVGLVTLDGRGSLSEVRPPTPDLARLSLTAMFALLRRREVLQILRDVRDYQVDVPPARLWHRTREVFTQIPVGVAHAEVVSVLRNRGIGAADVTTLVPISLRALSYEVPLNPIAAARLRDRLGEPAAAFA